MARWAFFVGVVACWVSVARGQDGVDLGGLKMEGRISFTGSYSKHAQFQPSVLEGFIRDFMNAQIYNVNCDSYFTGNLLFPSKVAAAMQTCVKGSGVQITRRTEDSDSSRWEMQYRVYTINTQAYTTVDQPTLCLSVNDVNRFRTWAMATLGYQNVKFDCAIDQRATNSTLAQPQPCRCGDPTMLQPAPVAESKWQRTAIAGLTLMSVLACALVVFLLYAQRAAKNSALAAPSQSHGQAVEGDDPKEVGFLLQEPQFRL